MSGYAADGPERWAELCGAESASQLAALLAGETAELELPLAADKAGRTRQHALVRDRFPLLLSDSKAGAAVVVRPQPGLKLIALDLDNTLWPGVLLEGLGEWPAVFHVLARLLLRLRSAGVLLLSLSRNDETPVLAAWPPPHVCALQPEHFVAHAFGWDAKSGRLSRFAAAVCVAHSAILFIDDSAAEREEVRAALPRLRVLGQDLQLTASLLAWEAGRLEAAGVSDEAAARTELTRALLARAAAAEAFSAPAAPAPPRAGGDKTRRRAARAMGARARVPGTGGGYATVGGFPISFLRTLQLRVLLRRHGAAEVGAPPPALQRPQRAASGLARAAELAARTTQFNTAAALPFAKWGAPQAALLAQFELLVSSAEGEAWTMTASDRFGDHGTVGVMLIDVRRRRVLLVAVSCRVLATEVAPVFAAECLRASPGLAARPGEDVRAGLAITERNAPCRSLWARLGFERDGELEGGEQDWVLRAGQGLPATDVEVYTVTQAEAEAEEAEVVETAEAKEEL